MSNPCRSGCDLDGDEVCVRCDHAWCSACGAPVPREDARPVHWVPAGVAPGVLCLACLAADGEDTAH